MFWCLRFCFLGSFPEEVLWKLDSLRGTSHWKAAQGKPSDRGGEDLEIPLPHSTRSPQLGSEWSWLGNPVKTFRNPSEGSVMLIADNQFLFKLKIRYIIAVVVKAIGSL